MKFPNPSESVSEPEEPVASSEETSFADILSQFEHEHEHAPSEALSGTVISVTPESVFVDIGRKMEGTLPIESVRDPAGQLSVRPGDTLMVNVSGRGEDGYYQLSMVTVKRPTDWSGLEKAFADGIPIGGTVQEVVKGGLRVDVGVRAFMPASRSGAKDPYELEKLVGQEIRCKIIKLDAPKEDVVVDRRAVLEQEEAERREKLFSELKEGTVIHGRVRTVTEFGAFVDMGGLDGLLHMADMSWTRVSKVSDVVSVGDSVEVKILKVDAAARRISLGMKQLSPDPWSQATESLKPGDRVRGKVVRLADFGAFVEIRPGVDGLIHLSELSWSKKIRKPSDVVKVGDIVEVVVLGVNPTDRRISLGLKQALGDPWDMAEQKYPAGAVVEGPVLNLTKFGAFVDLGDGLEGMIHVGDITREKRLEHPKEVLAAGQKVRAQVLELDRDRRRIRLGMKQLEPTSVDHYIAERTIGETVSGRIVSVEGSSAKVELGEGVTGHCRLPAETKAAAAEAGGGAKADIGSLTAKLAARWKQGGESGGPKSGLRAGQIRSFRITALDPGKKRIDLEFAE